MKVRTLTYLSLVLSVAALAYAAWIHNNADRAAVDALRERELAFVKSYTPKMQLIYSAMIGTTENMDAFPFHPKTIEELLKTLSDVIANFAGPDMRDAPAPLLKIPNEVPQ